MKLRSPNALSMLGNVDPVKFENQKGSFGTGYLLSK
jgi:hypothetical protein